MDFLLNGYKVMTKRRPPFEADLDLGPLPRRQVVKVAGRGRDGALLSEDEMVLNEGREAFRVQITAPEKGARLAGPVRLKAEVVVPETRRLQGVDFYVNEAKLATTPRSTSPRSTSGPSSSTPRSYGTGSRSPA